MTDEESRGRFGQDGMGKDGMARGTKQRNIDELVCKFDNSLSIGCPGRWGDPYRRWEI